MPEQSSYGEKNSGETTADKFWWTNTSFCALLGVGKEHQSCQLSLTVVIESRQIIRQHQQQTPDNWFQKAPHQGVQNIPPVNRFPLTGLKSNWALITSIQPQAFPGSWERDGSSHYHRHSQIPSTPALSKEAVLGQWWARDKMLHGTEQ